MKIILTTILFILSSFVGVHSEEDSHSLLNVSEVEGWLKQADDFRLKVDEGEVMVEIVLLRDNKKVESNQYKVAFNDQAQSRVEMLDTRVKGQKVLLLQEAMWLFVPRTKRAIRITPMQRLMGQASYGDVASMRWGDEYIWDESTYDEVKVNNVDAIKIGLAANRASSTYRKVMLWLNKETRMPIQAEFYLASGKLMKSARYFVSENDNTWINKIEFRQPGKVNELTVMTNQKAKEKKHPAFIFTRQGFIK